MRTLVTPTLAICLAAGLAVGIGLARPAAETAAAPDPVPAVVATTPAAGSTPIEIGGFAFSGGVVPAGTVVEVRNGDEVPHTVTALEASTTFDTGSVAGVSAATFTAPSRPGTYAYICVIHPGMAGELTVL